jgi:two-component system, NtrC family, sensor kinase
MHMTRWGEEDGEVTRDLGMRKHPPLDERRRRARLELLAVISAGLAQDVGTPLTALAPALDALSRRLGVLEMVFAVLPDAPRHAVAAAQGCRAALDQVEDIADYLVRMVHDYSRLDRRSGDEGATTPVRRAVETAVTLVRAQVAPRATLDVSVEGHPVAAMSETGLVRVLVNLMSYAAEALPAALRGRNRIVLSAKATANEVIVDVSDNGDGVAPELRRNLFEPFAADDAARGVGLALARALARDAGGELDLAATGTAGSTFRLRVPTP